MTYLASSRSALHYSNALHYSQAMLLLLLLLLLRLRVCCGSSTGWCSCHSHGQNWQDRKHS
jgi:hypothetical protein